MCKVSLLYGYIFAEYTYEEEPSTAGTFVATVHIVCLLDIKYMYIALPITYIAS